MSFTIAAGVIAVLFGLFGLRHPIKNLPASVRYSPVVSVALGAYLLWMVMATTTPVISNPQVKLLDAGQGYAIFQIQLRKDRDCAFKSMEAYLRGTDNSMRQAKIQFIDDLTPGNSRPPGMHVLEKTLVVPIDDSIPAKSVIFQTEHKCAFDIDIRSAFGETPLPAQFNRLDNKPLIH